MMLKLYLASLFVAVANGADLLEGEYCGVQGRDFLSPNFTGTVAVFGDGCASENNTNCLCGPNFEDGQSLSGFIFQCNGSLEFGPKGDKVCPPTVPVIKAVGVDSDDFSVEALSAGSPCNTSIHPTGRPGDESCGYSECETGGLYSAICGCVDLGNRSETETTGMQWICLHSTCGCSFNATNATEGGDDEPDVEVDPDDEMMPGNETMPESTSASTISTPFMIVAVTSCVAFVMAGL